MKSVTINLLPWRESQRKFNNWTFYIECGICTGIALFFIWMAALFMDGLIQTENNNIVILSKECEILKSQIKEVENLQQNKANLLKRIELIQKLNSDQSIVIQLLDLLPRITPEGINLTHLERKGEDIILIGSAKSQSFIATFWKNMTISKLSHLFNDVKLMDVMQNRKSQQQRKWRTSRNSSFSKKNQDSNGNPNHTNRHNEMADKETMDFKITFKLSAKQSCAAAQEDKSAEKASEEK